MKHSYKLLLLALLLALSACVGIIYPEYYASGSRNTSNQPEGEWTIYKESSNGALVIARDDYYVFGKGRYYNGKPEGLWTIWDSEGKKEYEMLFANGELNGETRIFHNYYSIQRLDKPVIARFENCQLKEIKAYEKGKLLFTTVLTENSECNESFRYKTQPETPYGTFVVRGIELTLFDGDAGFWRDGYITIIKNAPLKSKP